MSATFTPCMDILPDAQKKLWNALRPAAESGFALYGGTAIALRLGHRFSVDFDFFTDKNLDKAAIAKKFSFYDKSEVIQDSANTLTLSVPVADAGNDPVKLSFFGGISFGRVGSPEWTEDGVLQVASLEDLLATKAKVILQRAELKDYQDIAAMLKSGVDLAKGLAASQQMYGNSFQPIISLKAMTYFQDPSLNKLTQKEKHIILQAVENIEALPEVSILSRTLALPGNTLHDSLSVTQSENPAKPKKRIIVSNGSSICESFIEDKWQAISANPAGKLKAGIYNIHLATQSATDTESRGIIVHHDNEHIYQQVKNGDFVIHDRKAFKNVPDVGTSQKISYHGHQAIAENISTENKPNVRKGSNQP